MIGEAGWPCKNSGLSHAKLQIQREVSGGQVPVRLMRIVVFLIEYLAVRGYVQSSASSFGQSTRLLCLPAHFAVLFQPGQSKRMKGGSRVRERGGRLLVHEVLGKRPGGRMQDKLAIT